MDINLFGKIKGMVVLKITLIFLSHVKEKIFEQKGERYLNLTLILKSRMQKILVMMIGTNFIYFIKIHMNKDFKGPILIEIFLE